MEKKKRSLRWNGRPWPAVLALIGVTALGVWAGAVLLGEPSETAATPAASPVIEPERREEAAPASAAPEETPVPHSTEPPEEIIDPREEFPVEEYPTLFAIYDGETLFSRYFSRGRIGEETCIPGVPTELRKEDGSFYQYSTEPDGAGERYDPGDPFTPSRECTRLYAVWEPALIPNREEDNVIVRTFVQTYEKTEDRANSYITQGGTLVEREGHRYWVQAAIRAVEDDTCEKYEVGSAGNYTALFVYDFDTGEIVRSAFGIPFGHANDLEYDPHTDRFIICCGLQSGYSIMLLDWDLQSWRTFFPGGAEWVKAVVCAFDAEEQESIVIIPSKWNEYLHNARWVLRYDRDWRWLGTVTDPFDSWHHPYGTQGSCIWGDRLLTVSYVVDDWQQNGKRSFWCNRINLYDKEDFRYLGSFPLNIGDEIEDIVTVGNKAYINGQIHRDREDEPWRFHLYELDLSTLDALL